MDAMTPTDDATLYFACPQCQTRLQAPAAWAGTRRRCPCCQMTVEVPRHTRAPTPDEGYPLQQGTPAAEQPAYVLVICPVCHTRLHATEDQIGEEIVCPDCGTATEVTRPAETLAQTAAKKPFRSAEEIGDYLLVGEIDRAAGEAPTAEESYVPVVCSVCHTRLLATLGQVGGKLVCPDCGTANVVPPPTPRRPKIDPMAGAGEGYGLIGWDEKGPIETASPSGASCGAGVSPAQTPFGAAVPAARAGETPAPRPPTEPPAHRRRQVPLPPRPFLTGTFSFPLSASVRVRVLLLAMGALVPLRLAAKSLVLASAPPVPTSAPAWLSSALIMALAVILGLMWFTFASACALAVVRDTANGLNDITSWSGQDFLDYLLDPLYLFNSACVSVLPGVVLGWLLARYGLSGRVLGPAGAMLLFPIVLLSMLESGSPLAAISGLVWRTLAVAARGWAAFYLTSAALLLMVGATATVGQWIGGLWGTIVAAATLAAGWLIYFRLLGRLAWYCADRTAETEPDEEAEDEATGELHVQAAEMVPVTFVFCPRCGKRVEIGRVPVGAEVDCPGCGRKFALACKS